MTRRQIAISTAILMAVLMALPVGAQVTPPTYLLMSGSLTASSTSCAATACVQMPVVSAAGTVAIQLAGTFSATVQFEGSVDSTNWVSIPVTPIAGATQVTSAVAAGIWQTSATGLRGVRARVSAFTSGTVATTLVRSPLAPLINTANLGIVQPTATVPFAAASTFPINGLTAPTSLADVSGKIFYSQVFVPTNVTLTGACILVGGGTPTDKVMLGLYSQAGTLLANTAAAGVTLSGAGTYQCIPFTVAYAATGPQSYFFAVQGNGATAGQFYVYTAGSAPTSYVTGAQTGGTFGTLGAITSVATSFTAAVGPVGSFY